MKLRKPEREPFLKTRVWYETEEESEDEDGEPITIVTEHLKTTPKIKNERRRQLELKELRQPPKKSLEKIIVPNKSASS